MRVPGLGVAPGVLVAVVLLHHPQRHADRGQREDDADRRPPRVPTGARADRASDAVAQCGDDRVVDGWVDPVTTPRRRRGHQPRRPRPTRPRGLCPPPAGVLVASVGDGDGDSVGVSQPSSPQVSLGVSVGVSLGVSRRRLARRLRRRLARRRLGRLRRLRRLRRRRGRAVARGRRLAVDVHRLRELLDVEALHVPLHHRGPGLRRVGAAEEGLEVAVQRLRSLAAHVDDRGRELRGVAGEPGGHDVAVAVGRGPGLAGRRAVEIQRRRTRARQHDLLQGVGDVGRDVRLDGVAAVDPVVVAHLAVGVGDLLDDVRLRGLAVRGQGAVGVRHVDRAHGRAAECDTGDRLEAGRAGREAVQVLVRLHLRAGPCRPSPGGSCPGRSPCPASCR